MATFKITAASTVATLKKQFVDQIGGTLRVYAGRSLAEDSAKLASIGAKTGTWECRTSRTVGRFQDAFKEEFNLKVTVATADNWVAVLPDITLENVKNIPAHATKESMEALISNYSKSGKKVEDKAVEPKASTSKKPTAPEREIPEEYRNLPMVKIRFEEMKLDEMTTKSVHLYPFIGIMHYENDGGDTYAQVYSDGDSESTLDTGKIALINAQSDICIDADSGQWGLSSRKEFHPKFSAATEVAWWGFPVNVTRNGLSTYIGMALAEFFNGGNDQYYNYYVEDEDDEAIQEVEKVLFNVDGHVFTVTNDGDLEMANLTSEEFDQLLKARKEEPITGQDYEILDKDWVKGRTPVKAGNHVGYINDEGHWVIPPIYDWQKKWNSNSDKAYFDHATKAIEAEDRWGVIDTEGNEIIPCIYEEIDYWEKNDDENYLIPVKLKGKWGFINLENDTVIPFQYDMADNFFEGKADVEKDGKSFEINEKGEILPDDGMEE